MASNSSRIVHGIQWQDDLAWMEAMKGERWNAFLRKHQTRWETKVDKVSESISLFAAELEAARKTAAVPLFEAATGTVEISVGGTVSLGWRWKGEDKLRPASELYARRGGYVWAVEEVGDGAEVYAVRLYKKGKESFLWEHRGVAPTVAVVGNRCYCILAKNRLVYHTLVSWQAFSGKDQRIYYEEHDYRYNLELIRGSDTHAYLRRQAGAKQDAFILEEEGVKLLESISLESRRFGFGSRAAEYFIWTSASGWKVSPALKARGFTLPSFTKAVPEILDTERGFLVTKWQGCRTLWKIKRGSPPYTLWRNYGQILIDPWDGPWVRFTQPGVETVWWNSEEDTRPHTAFAWSRESYCKFAKSADGTSIPFLLTAPENPKGLLVVGYGAYGVSTPVSTSRWEPLLKRGWAVAIGLWRGGGDHTPEWEDAGRVHGRTKVLEDAEAVVRGAQKETGCSPKQTVLYGRSAGGLWVGGLVAKHPRGDLAGGAYMEVPYLDALRTMTNRTLPLTDIEADEFGLPEQRLSDFASALEWSPMELLPESGVKGVWQIVRTGLNDSEVFAYESAKWVERCGAAAYLAIEGGQGHFVSGAVGLRQQATDLAILEAFLTNF